MYDLYRPWHGEVKPPKLSLQNLVYLNVDANDSEKEWLSLFVSRTMKTTLKSAMFDSSCESDDPVWSCFMDGLSSAACSVAELTLRYVEGRAKMSETKES